MGLPPDVMHDVLEGIVPYTSKLLLHHLIDDLKLITLDQLNSTLRSFDYGFLEAANKPSQIQATVFCSSDKTNLGQSGEQHFVATIM